MLIALVFVKGLLLQFCLNVINWFLLIIFICLVPNTIHNVQKNYNEVKTLGTHANR